MQPSTPAFETRLVPVRGLADASSVVIRGRAILEEAPELRRALLGRVDEVRTPKTVLYLGDVDEMDTAGAAVVFEALKHGHALGQKVLICSASESVVRMFRLAGLEEALRYCTSCPEETQRRLLE